MAPADRATSTIAAACNGNSKPGRRLSEPVVHRLNRNPGRRRLGEDRATNGCRIHRGDPEPARRAHRKLAGDNAERGNSRMLAARIANSGLARLFFLRSGDRFMHRDCGLGQRLGLMAL